MKHHIAIYGKGGIGKTTVSVNLALALAARGKRVLLVGCDPKQDTTRLLWEKPLPSIMEQYEPLLHGQVPPESVIIHPRENLWCCEVGGPKPGVGCAGRGITIALAYLEKTGYFARVDVVLYDVLGDIVCGGFASPVTRGYAEQIYVVTSGEQAALFAANNLIRGMEAIRRPVSGIVCNGRGFAGETELVDEFSAAVGVPVTASIPYAEEIKLGEIDRRPISECPGAEKLAAYYGALAGRVLAPDPPGAARPLESEALYELVRRKYYETRREAKP